MKGRLVGWFAVLFGSVFVVNASADDMLQRGYSVGGNDLAAALFVAVCALILLVLVIRYQFRKRAYRDTLRQALENDSVMQDRESQTKEN